MINGEPDKRMRMGKGKGFNAWIGTRVVQGVGLFAVLA